MPRTYHPLADALSATDLDDFLAQNRKSVFASAAKMPTHAQFIEQHCRAAGVGDGQPGFSAGVAA
jgi:tryptophan halogenase